MEFVKVAPDIYTGYQWHQGLLRKSTLLWSVTLVILEHGSVEYSVVLGDTR